MKLVQSLLVALALALLGHDALAQSRPDKLRIGYAARAVAHSVPYVAKEAGFFSEEGIDAEIVRTAGSIAPMALVTNEVDLAIMSAYLMILLAVQNRDVVMLGGFSRYASMDTSICAEYEKIGDTEGHRPQTRPARISPFGRRQPGDSRRARNQRVQARGCGTEH